MNKPLGVSPSKGNQGATRDKEKIFDLGGNRTHDLRIRSTVILPTELRGRTEKVGHDIGPRLYIVPDFLCLCLLGLTPSGLFMGSVSTKIYTSELILCFTILIFARTTVTKYKYQILLL